MDQPADIPLYVQLISGTILGVALANLLGGAGKFVQQPRTHKFNVLHGLWIVFIFGSIAVFWWQEALTFANVKWTFPLYLFQTAYCASYLFMTAVLLPDSIEGFDNHYDYFISRRVWFYGAVSISFLLSMGDSLVKEGWDDILVSPEYIILNVAVLALLGVGAVFDRRWVQIAVAGILVLLTIGSMLAE